MLEHRCRWSIPTRNRDTIDVRIYQYHHSTAPKIKQRLFIHLHGGGFMFGSLAADDPLCYRVASRLKITVFRINYRHTPEFVYPTQVNDVCDAVNWAFSNLKEYNVDLENIVIGGISAGADLSMATVVKQLDQDQDRIKGMLLAAPVFGLRNERFHSGIISPITIPSYVQNKRLQCSLAKESILSSTITKVPSGDVQYFNVMNLMADKLRRLGPERACLMICGLNPFRDEDIVWEEKLSRVGKETKMHLYPGLPHGLGLGSVRKDVFAPKHRWDADYVDGVRWFLRKKKPEASE